MKKSLLYILTITALSAGVLAEAVILRSTGTPNADEISYRQGFTASVMMNDFSFFSEEPDGGHFTSDLPADILRYDPFISDTSYSSFSRGYRP
ncbi:MAG: hypothetical protein AB7E96_03045 [Deferribacterales bacterium]